ncbi:MAG: hypothetical protein IPK55_14805 [Streptococcus sp.]|nr:hypothetical protein [Streptococcus sp.]
MNTIIWSNHETLKKLRKDKKVGYLKYAEYVMTSFLPMGGNSRLNELEQIISLCQFVLWDEEPALLFNGALGFYKKDLVEDDERETDYMIMNQSPLSTSKVSR